MTKPSPWAIGTTQTSPFVPRRGITAVPRAFDLECTLKTFHVTKKSNTQEKIFKWSILFSVWGQNFITQENTEHVCQCLHRHVMMWLCSHVLCVNPLRLHHPSLTCRSTCLLHWDASHCGMPVAIQAPLLPAAALFSPAFIAWGLYWIRAVKPCVSWGWVGCNWREAGPSFPAPQGATITGLP